MKKQETVLLFNAIHDLEREYIKNGIHNLRHNLIN